MGSRISRAGWAASLVVTAAVIAGCSSAESALSESNEIDTHAAAFLDQWVEDGRVVRHDQGGDTVSEGQAYGMLAAVVAGDERRFDELWSWTQEELLRPDGLLAWRWDAGEVIDDEPASDAELDAARALVLAGDRFDRNDLTDDGAALSTALLDELTAETALGRVLLPGLWAEGEDPLPYNPSYASPAAFEVLGSATGDERWDELAEGSSAATSALFDVADLPPDWAQIHADGTVAPLAGPFGEGEGVTYGYDAQRTLVRYAESCEPADRALIATAAAPLSYTEEPAAVLDLGGGAVTADRSPLSIVARAAASAAGGDQDAARTDLETAARLSSENPTYYGGAWVALGVAMLEGDLGGCDVLDDSANPFSAGGLQNPSGTDGSVDAGVPVAVHIPSLGISSTLEDLAVDSTGELQAPADYEKAGWYADGVAPGAVGPAIIAGHVDSPTGPAVFQRIDELAPGDAIVVGMSGGQTLTFTVTGATQASKSAFPTADVYSNVPTPALRLITCAGDFDRSVGHYTDNLIVFAALSA